jgi:hypothetical protein
MQICPIYLPFLSTWRLSITLFHTYITPTVQNTLYNTNLLTFKCHVTVLTIKYHISWEQILGIVRLCLFILLCLLIVTPTEIYLHSYLYTSQADRGGEYVRHLPQHTDFLEEAKIEKMKEISI